MINIKSEILHLKKIKNALILSHFYQKPEIQNIADFVGDSLELSKKAADTTAEIIVLAGVRFMAETIKILSPQKKVLIPDVDAGCSLADNCTRDGLFKFRNKYPEYCLVTYINSNADVKAISDIICTSSNAVKVIESIPKNVGIVFAPDMNLGKYLIKKTNRKMVLWQGTCQVHESFSVSKILNFKKEYPDAKIIAHPECSYLVLEVADFIGSTSKLLNYAINNTAKEFIVVTEEGILHQMRTKCPDKKFIPAPPVYYTYCACGECPYMKLITLEKIYLCLLDEQPEITIQQDICRRAIIPLKRMMQLS